MQREIDPSNPFSFDPRPVLSSLARQRPQARDALLAGTTLAPPIPASVPDLPGAEAVLPHALLRIPGESEPFAEPSAAPSGASPTEQRGNRAADHPADAPTEPAAIPSDGPAAAEAEPDAPPTVDPTDPGAEPVPAGAPATPDPAPSDDLPVTDPVRAPDGDAVDLLGHFGFPPGEASAEALPDDVVRLADAIADDPDAVAGIGAPCRVCGGEVRFLREPRPGGTLLRALTPCPAPGGLGPYEAPLQVPSGALVVAPDLHALIDLPPPSCALEERDRDLDRARHGIAVVRSPDPGAALHLGRDGPFVAAGGPEGTGPAPVSRPAIGRRVEVMDAGLFGDLCARVGIAPEWFRPTRVPVEAGAYRVSHLPSPTPGSPLATFVRTGPVAEPPAPPVAGDGLADGFAHALLSSAARRTGSPFGAFRHLLCEGYAPYAWSRGLLRPLPAPRDPIPAGDGPRGDWSWVPAWTSLVPRGSGPRGAGPVGYAERLDWMVAPLGPESRAPLLRTPDALHPHWLSACLLLARTLLDRPELAHGGGAAHREALETALGRLAALAERHPDAAGVRAGVDDWLALDMSGWTTPR